MTSLARRATAEAIGTFFLVFCGCGAIVVSSSTGAITGIGIALVFGLVITVSISSLGHVSGAHFNPAVTSAFVLVGKLPLRDAPAYMAAQLCGAVFASFALLFLFGNVASLGATVPHTDSARAFLLEFLITGLLVFVIIAVATDPRAFGNLAPLAIGGTVALCAIWCGPITGASMNPARSLGPALVAGVWGDQWIYVAAPILGGALGAIAYQAIRDR